MFEKWKFWTFDTRYENQQKLNKIKLHRKDGGNLGYIHGNFRMVETSAIFMATFIFLSLSNSSEYSPEYR